MGRKCFSHMSMFIPRVHYNRRIIIPFILMKDTVLVTNEMTDWNGRYTYGYLLVLLVSFYCYHKCMGIY